ncbi:hypothetical protein [Cupriavidus sp. TMH.W2]|uniref:hypothetical protein n=1 Tax=Cupriavidus sp. TMH.W2 TaxID=3434465 RepID=UPI003D778FA0
MIDHRHGLFNNISAVVELSVFIDQHGMRFAKQRRGCGAGADAWRCRSLPAAVSRRDGPWLEGDRSRPVIRGLATSMLIQSERNHVA